MNASGYLSNCFWLFVPILLFNLVFARRLPPAYRRQGFSKDVVPLAVAIPENLLRMAVMLLPVFMPLSADSPRHKFGLTLYVLGVLIYCASWIVRISWPASAWSTSAIGFMAPAYTPLLWLMGIVLIGDGLFVPQVPYRPWMYAVLVGTFLLFHNLHAAIVYARNHRLHQPTSPAGSLPKGR